MIQRYILKNWIWLVIGFLLTAWAVEFEYRRRGYAAVGSEWFITPMLLLIVHFSREFIRNDLPMLIEIFTDDGGDE